MAHANKNAEFLCVVQNYLISFLLFMFSCLATIIQGGTPLPRMDKLIVFNQITLEVISGLY